MSKKNILCFGDSNTWGYVPGSDYERFPADVRWPGVMHTCLGPGFHVIEEAQNGRMSVWEDPMEPLVSKCGMDQLPAILESHMPLDLVIIMLGTNDLKNHLNNSAAMIAQGVITLVDYVLSSTAGPEKSPPPVLVICPVPVFDGPCPFGHLFDDAAGRSREMAACYAEMAEDRGVAFLNAGDFAACPDTDCIHIDAAGHADLGKAVAQKIARMKESDYLGW
ncbi:MAG: SGNH/GDSL hydrolase family protein [Verrucomicrobiales bacterium]|nr:SGNH/GDSL hydrolase family protein [Verrucomicrobiales bacterium]